MNELPQLELSYKQPFSFKEGSARDGVQFKVILKKSGDELTDELAADSCLEVCCRAKSDQSENVLLSICHLPINIDLDSFLIGLKQFFKNRGYSTTDVAIIFSGAADTGNENLNTQIRNLYEKLFLNLKENGFAILPLTANNHDLGGDYRRRTTVTENSVSIERKIVDAVGKGVPQEKLLQGDTLVLNFL